MDILTNANLHLQRSLTNMSANLSGFNLHLAGILVLADLQIVAKRAALTGTSAWTDIFVLAPGLHKQATAPDLCKGEYPACAAMTTGYVFRVENPATVLYLQSVGRPGHLTTLSVQSAKDGKTGAGLANMAYSAAVLLTMFVLASLAMIGDFFGVATLTTLMIVRLVNTIVMRRRARPGWFGLSEPDVHSDLLVLLSQDRWIRIQGATDDVKAVTSGTWLEECTALQTFMLALGTLLTYLSVIVVSNASIEGKLLLMALLLASSGLLGLSNQLSKSMSMHGRRLNVKSGPEKYNRRLDLAKELITEFGRTDCFEGMGMIQPNQAKELSKSYKGPVVM